MDRRSKNGAPGPSALNERSNVNATSKIATRSSVTTRAQANKKSPTAAKRPRTCDDSFDLDADLGVDFQKFGIGVVETEDQLRSADDDYKYPENDTYEKLLHDYDLLLDSYEVLEAKEKLGFRERELLKRENSLLKRENELLVNKVSDLELQLRPASVSAQPSIVPTSSACKASTVPDPPTPVAASAEKPPAAKFPIAQTSLASGISANHLIPTTSASPVPTSLPMTEGRSTKNKKRRRSRRGGLSKQPQQSQYQQQRSSNNDALDTSSIQCQRSRDTRRIPTDIVRVCALPGHSYAEVYMAVRGNAVFKAAVADLIEPPYRMPGNTLLMRCKRDIQGSVVERYVRDILDGKNIATIQVTTSTSLVTCSTLDEFTSATDLQKALLKQYGVTVELTNIQMNFHQNGLQWAQIFLDEKEAGKLIGNRLRIGFMRAVLQEEEPCEAN